MAETASNQTYENIDRPYGDHLERDSDYDINVEAEPTTTSGAGTSSPGGYGTESKTAVTDEQGMTDLWIENQIRSKEWKPKTQGFMIDGRSGYAEFSNVYISGAITVTAGGTVGGWTVGTNDLSSGNVSLNSLEEQILLGSATAPLTGAGIFIGKDGSDYELRAGDPSGAYIHWDGAGLTIKGPVLSDITTGSEVAIQDWTYTGTFSSLDADSIQWTGGTLTLAGSGESFTINAGATGDMTGFNYIYFDKNVSTTNLQVDTSFTAGSGKIIIATAQNGSSEASFLMMGGDGAYNIDGENIAAESIIAGKLSVGELSAVSANMGTLNAGKIDVGNIEISADDEHILMGSASDPTTGVGIFLGRDASDYEFRAGDPDGQRIHWDGSELNVVGAQKTSILLTAGEDIEAGEPVCVAPGGDGYDNIGGVSGVSTKNFGTTSAEMTAIKFTMDDKHRPSGIDGMSRRVGSPGDEVIVGVMGDNGGEPDGVYQWYGSRLGSGIPSSKSYNGFTFDTGTVPDPQTSTDYWIVFSRSGALDNSNYYQLYCHSSSDSNNKEFNGSAWVNTNIGFEIGNLNETLTAGYAYVSYINTFIDSSLATQKGARWEYIGFAANNANVGEVVEVVIAGIADGFTGLTVGSIYYLTETWGTISTTPPGNLINDEDEIRGIGRAISSTQIALFYFQQNAA